MKLFIIFSSVLFFLLFSMNGVVYGADTISPSDNHTAREEAEGKAIWEKLQAKGTSCDTLSQDNFERLGEYFMGQVAGSSHEAMNNMMAQMMGEKGEEQMHVIMGKRLSGCSSSAHLSSQGTGFMPMMGSGFGNMMGGWGGFGTLGWLSMLIFWAFLILGVIALIRYIGGSGKRSDKDKSPLDILKERYARGEVGKKEFEEMKKDLR